MTFWDSPQWLAYEVAYGDEPGTRARLLASAAWQTQVIDLTQSEAALWTSVRKSYKALIRKAEYEGGLFVFVESTAPINRLWLQAFQRAHHQAAGRATRNDETWECLLRWLNEGLGLLVATDSRAFAYFVVRNSWAYYFSAASLNPNVNHALVWTAMKALKDRGVHTLEMGWQGQATDPKGQQIEFFRRGFGGQTIPARQMVSM